MFKVCCDSCDGSGRIVGGWLCPRCEGSGEMIPGDIHDDAEEDVEPILSDGLAAEVKRPPNEWTARWDAYQALDEESAEGKAEWRRLSAEWVAEWRPAFIGYAVKERNWPRKRAEEVCEAFGMDAADEGFCTDLTPQLLAERDVLSCERHGLVEELA